MARDPESALPREPIRRVVAPFERFLHVEAASGVVLLAFTLLALVLANSPLGDAFLGVWKTKVGFRFGGFEVEHSLKHWINDGLMAVFFFVIGLEVKRELVLGELRDPRRAALPMFAAVGGMVVPAGVYLALQGGGPAARGWGIPMATDIAFVVGVLALLGPRVPPSLRVLLVSLAIVDDIGAILVIAVGYTSGLDLGMLAVGAAAIALVRALAMLGVRSVGVYAAVAVVVWFGFHESGVHATIAGVILGLLTPARSWVGHGTLEEVARRGLAVLRGEGGEGGDGGARRRLLREVEIAARETLSPLERLEALLHPWVGFAIMPLFAFANAGVPFEAADLADPVGLAVGLGLVVGKPLGVLLACGLAVRLGFASLPPGVSWRAVAGGGCLAGIGFTMALFIADLALAGEALDAAKVGVLGASLVAGLLGAALLATLPASERDRA